MNVSGHWSELKCVCLWVSSKTTSEIHNETMFESLTIKILNLLARLRSLHLINLQIVTERFSKTKGG